MKGFTFRRYEIKYLLTPAQYFAILPTIEAHVAADEYGETTIQSLYYDTPNFRLIRRSMEKPVYKEKIRLRSYGLAKEDTKVFLELKKKYKGIVYKRRIRLTEREAFALMTGEENAANTQIGKEIVYFRDFYGDLRPAMSILYDRTAYENEETGLRVTFDKNIRYRTERLTLHEGLDGIALFSTGEVLMEIKAGGAYPLWLAELLTKNGIYKTSFSKYGRAYCAYDKHLKEDKKVV